MRTRVFVVIGPALAAAALLGGSGAAHEGARGPAFSVPRQIVVSVAPYESVGRALADANNVDWDRDIERARAVTLAYAAHELRDHLRLAGVSASLSSPKAHQSEPSITLVLLTEPPGRSLPVAQHLAVDREALGAQGYAIVPHNRHVLIVANTAVGVLYGAYTLLEELGFAWHDPFETLVPEAATLAAPRTWRSIRGVPRVARRGFWIYGEQETPEAFAVWMARNKLNLGGKHRVPLQRMLGIVGWSGGHELLQEEFSRPGLFESHPDWYAEVGGIRRPIPATGFYFNPSFANADAAAYFADRIAQRLETGDLAGVDILNIWPADSRFNVFDQSAAAISLGNETDNLLAFYVNVCAGLRRAQADGRLSRPVTVAGISYYLTMTPPTNQAVVAAMGAADYLHLFYPIDRDWAGQFNRNLSDRDSNRRTLADMDAWRSLAGLRYGVVEYHNLSAYGAVALTDHPSLAVNYGILTDGRSELYAYMHPLLQNAGPRRLTNMLQARLGWRSLDAFGGESTLARQAEDVTREYFASRYGKYASEWRSVYDLMARSVENCAEMFFSNSLSWVLLQEFIWATPPYTRADAAAFIPRYRAGGTQDLPAAFSRRTTERATFRGLDDSLALQAESLSRSQVLLSGSMDARVRLRMQSDLDWFEATASRYRLLSASADLVISRNEGTDETQAMARVVAEIEALSNSQVIRDAISPVNQAAFLELHRRLVSAP